MELLLNLIWLAVVLGTTVMFALWMARGGCDGRRTWLVATALVCVLALLFPIISITDDLHWSATRAEEVRRASTVSLTSVIVSFVLPLVVVGVVLDATFFVPSSPDAAVFSLRGPPVNVGPAL